MPHPNGGRGNTFPTTKTFAQAYAHVSSYGLKFNSTTGEPITAAQGVAQDRLTETINFQGENSRHGNVCEQCWGFRKNCSGARIGHCVEALNAFLAKDL
ncbi:hypothetical protein [uncultured Desulfosarcina sp.]|uniref:hypothetical protein n=1 Tax=uncultured Desulfosarcina sp. TaxID=218289 RepID=UPI0029C629B9|nr:hypothetical protein [uncultured Desulfosarcina sp.]